MDHEKEPTKTQKATNKKYKHYYTNTKTKQSNIFYYCGSQRERERERERIYLQDNKKVFFIISSDRGGLFWVFCFSVG